MNVFFDIETIPAQPEAETKAEIAKTITAPAQMSKQETIDAWHNGGGKYAGEKDRAIEEAYRKTSFDGAQGQICVISWAVGKGDIQIVSTNGISEAAMLRFFFDSVLVELGGKEAKFVGHYIAGFDLKFLWQRCVINNVVPSIKLPFKGRHGQDYFCTMTEWAGFKDRISLDNLAKALGIEGKSGMDGSQVWDEWKAGNFQKVADYCKDDVRIVREIHNRMLFI